MISRFQQSNSKKRKSPSGSNRGPREAPFEPMNFKLEYKPRKNGPAFKLSSLLSEPRVARVSVIVEPGKQIFSLSGAEFVRTCAWRCTRDLTSVSSAEYHSARLPTDGSPFDLRLVFSQPMPWPCNFPPLVSACFDVDKKCYNTGKKKNFAYFLPETPQVAIFSHCYAPECSCCGASAELFQVLLTFDASNDDSCMAALFSIGASNTLESFRAQLTPFVGTGKVAEMPPIHPSRAHLLYVSELFVHVNRPHKWDCTASFALAEWNPDTDRLQEHWLSTCASIQPVPELNITTWADAARICTNASPQLVAPYVVAEPPVFQQQYDAPHVPLLPAHFEDPSSDYSVSSAPSSPFSYSSEDPSTASSLFDSPHDSVDDIDFDGPPPKRVRLNDSDPSDHALLAEIGFFADPIVMDNDLSSSLIGSEIPSLAASGQWLAPSLSASQTWSFSDASFL